MKTKEIDNFIKTIYKNDIEKFKKFLESGIDVNYETEHGTALEIANDLNRTEIFKLLLNHPDLKIMEKDGYLDDGLLLLHFSCDRKDVEAVKLLVNKFHIDPSIRGYDGRTPLHRACKQNNSKTVRFLLSQPNVDVNTKDYFQWTPLCYACAYNSIESINILFEQPNIEINYDYEDEEIDVEEIKWEISPLYIACEQGRVDAVKLLLSRPEIQVNFNYSVFSDNKEIFNLLKKHLKY